jgi:hypothetical protein
MIKQVNDDIRVGARSCAAVRIAPDRRYARHFDVVPGSLDCPTDELVVGDWELEPACGGSSVPMNLRFSGDVVFLDRGTQPRIPLKGGQLRDWVVAQRSIQPVCIARRDLRLTGGAGWRVAVVPRGCGGGIVYERPDALKRSQTSGTAARRLLRRIWNGA